MYSKILVPIDGSAASRLGLTEAIRLAKSTSAKIRLLHSVDEFIMDTSFAPAMNHNQWISALREGGQATLDNAVKLAREAGIDPDARLIETIGKPAAEVILEEARQWPADVIVLGTHGRRGVRRMLMGSDAEAVLRSSPVPVLMVREKT